MKKVIIAAGFVMFSMAAFASVSKEKSTINKSKTNKSKLVICTPSSTKVFHRQDCPGFYSVDYVETTIVTCVNGVAVSNCYHWDQQQSLICS